jgi:hypothetical protein
MKEKPTRELWGHQTNFLAAISWQTFAITNKNQQEKERYSLLPYQSGSLTPCT